jgi:nicotinate-nucleotide adenylyltransferase
VLWVPVGTAPHREVADDPGPEVRLRLCELAVAGDERFAVSRLEVGREGPSYTVDTLRELADAGRELVLVLGSDQALAFPTWHAPGEVLELAEVAVAARGGAARSDVQERFDELGGGDRLRFFDMPRIDVSSTLVRRHAGAGWPIRYLVPDPVAEHVREHGLYASSVGAGTG